MGEISRRLNAQDSGIESAAVSAAQLAALIGRIQDGTISNNAAKQVFEVLWSGEASDEYAQATRQREQEFLDAGIHSVPAIILNRQHLISGGQPVEVFERALRQVAGAANTPAASVQSA